MNKEWDNGIKNPNAGIVYRNSPLSALLLCLFLTAPPIVGVIFLVVQPLPWILKIPVFVGILFYLLIASVTWINLARLLSPFNWLLYWENERLKINFRHYFNQKHKKDHETVLILSLSEIAWARKLKTRFNFTNSYRRAQSYHQCFLELRLKDGIPTGDLEKLITLEQQFISVAAKERGAVSMVPVQWKEKQKILRVHWNPSFPSLGHLLQKLESSIPIEEELTLKLSDNENDTDKLNDLIAELITQGQTTRAIAVLKYQKGFNTTEAVEWISQFKKSA